jgi:hypothetical protein
MEKQAWIQDPRTANMARFHLDPKTWSAYPMYLWMLCGRYLALHHFSRPAATCI